MMNPLSFTDHPELHAPIPAQVSCGLCGPPQGQREIRRRELQNLCFRGNPLHRGHGVPEPPGKKHLLAYMKLTWPDVQKRTAAMCGSGLILQETLWVQMRTL